MLKKILVAAAAAATAVMLGGGATAQADALNVVAGPVVTIGTPTGGYPGRGVAEAFCPAGQVRTGGGATVKAGTSSHAELYQLGASQPVGNEGWWAFGTNMDPSSPGTIQAFVICAKMSTETELSTP